MLDTQTEQSLPDIVLPDITVMAAAGGQVALLSPDGEIKMVPYSQAAQLVHKKPVLTCNAPYMRHRIRSYEFLAFDVLELFAFTHPAQFCVPTISGLADFLGYDRPGDLEDEAMILLSLTEALLHDIRNEPRSETRKDPADIAEVMGLQGNGWVWAPYIFQARGKDYDVTKPVMSRTALNVWKYLPEWSESAPPPPPSHQPVTGEESRQRLEMVLGPDAEKREPQIDYTTRLTAAFTPADTPDHPHVVLAEAGTGVGKTLGYLAPASVWADKNQGSVWVSTYTKNLQRQVHQELSAIYPNPELKKEKVAVRKGRENYLCLLNFDDTATGAALAKHPDQAVAAGLMARWIEVSHDGDLQGGDFPGWLTGLLGFKHTKGLSDTRGECIYSACDHYHKCFVEKAVRRSKHASVVVANHALVMIQSALATTEEELPQRYVFDEAHHLFDAADSAFAGHLTAREAHDLRRWILGAEGGKRTRARGLSRRVEDLISGDADAENALQDIKHAAHKLPAMGWSRRMKDANPQGPTEKFLHLVYQQVFARSPAKNSPYSLEAETKPLVEGLPKASEELKDALFALKKALQKLTKLLRKKLEDQADTLDSDSRKRLEAVCNSLTRRSEFHVSSWVSMLDTLLEMEAPSDVVDWMEIERIDGKAIDVGLYRHFINPMVPFASALRPHAHGIAMTAATLKDRTEDEDENWRVAKERTGAEHLSPVIDNFDVPSPYDHAKNTRIFIVTDVTKHDLDQVASAYKALFEAAGGGSLGLFTAVQRLKQVREKIAEDLEKSGYPLYAQHFDGMDTGTLVDVFRDEPHACLLGTDAVRDGIDVPGDSLRLLVYDRVPWPRPTILHKARREAFGSRKYDERITRLRLTQAYGRLIRRASDTGVFVMMDAQLPSRLHNAFPEGVSIERLGLSDVVQGVREFLNGRSS